MKEENVKQIMRMVEGKIPEDRMIVLKNKLIDAPEDKVEELLSVTLYNPTHILVFSIFLGWLGVDRFMIGDTGLGIGKLITGWFTCFIWAIIDIFISYNRAKEKNLNKLIMLL